jgi:Anti-sigma factor NepR
MPGKIAGKPRKRAKKDRGPKGASARADPAAADRFIGDQLKAIYDSVIAEPVPDRLLELLDRLDRDAEK